MAASTFIIADDHPLFREALQSAVVMAFADADKIAYWKDVDLYIGGSEHATGHLLYSRVLNKFLKYLCFLTEEETFKKIF